MHSVTPFRLRPSFSDSRHMRRGAGLITAVAAVTVSMTATAAPAGDPVSGKMQYEAKCGGCHSLDTNRIGPLHRGVVGRRPASAPGYAYSPALRKLGGIWTPMRLDQWLQGPQKLAPGTKMFNTVGDATTRSNIIAYLQTTSPAKARGR